MHGELRTFMTQAIEEARRSPAGDARVGAVLVLDGAVVTTGHKSETAPRRHAELVALDKAAAAGIDLTGATAFVTLEPCANLEGNRTPCAQRLADAGITTVYIGRYDRMFRVYRLGWKLLVDHGVTCRDFPGDLRDELDRLNATQDNWFLRREGLRGTARFDHTQNGRYELRVDDDPSSPSWQTEWKTCGSDSIYAYGGRPGFVAHARYARTFDQVNDPDAYDYGRSSAELGTGDIAIYRNDYGHALVRLREVEAEPPYGSGPHTSVLFDFELRPRQVHPATDDAP